MSCRPHALASNCPTELVLPPEFSSYQPYSRNCWGSSPKQYVVVVPARAAYSHSASVGNRYDFPSFSASRPKKSCTSSHETLSTGRFRSPLKWLGLFPITASHCACVVGYLAR